jgi:signal transduction histidine kinase
MKFFSYVPLLGGFINLILSAFVLLSDRRSRVNQVFFALGVSVAIWNFGSYILFQDQSPSDAYRWAKFLQYGVIFVPVTMLHLSMLLCGKRPGRWFVLVYAFHFVLAGMNASDLFIGGVRRVFFGYYCVAGIGFKIYGLAFVQSFASIILLWRQRRSLPVRQRARFNGILAAQTLLVVLGTNDLMPIFGVDYYPFTSIHILPWGSLAAAAYGLMVAYSVFQHQLMDVRVVLGRSAAYLVRFMFLLFIAVMLELVVAAVAPPGQVTGFSIVSSILVIIISTLLASLLFPKLLGGAAEDLERRLLGDHFEYQDKVRAFIEECRWHTELDGLLRELRSLLVNVLKVRSFWFILLDESNRAFTLVRAMPECPQKQIPGLRVDSAVFKFLKSGNPRYIGLRPESDLRQSRSQAEALEELKDFPGDLAFPLFVDQQPLGLLIVGAKTSGDAFTRTDAQLLSEVTTNIALVINQISIKNELLQAKELDLLGRMSQGMAHDLNNLITPVWTLLQLLTEGVPADTLRIDIAPVAVRNLQTMREYIKEALFFSQNLRPDFQMARLDVLVEEVVDLARQNKRKGKDIRYTFRSCGDVPMEMDQVLIRRLLTNILANAVDASKEGDTLDVEVIRLVKTDAERDWFRVRVTDHGSGIPTENLDRIFQPYFSTKKTGDENRGFGLGLAICRKIAALHGGNLVVSSEVGRGTIVNLDLPNRQKTAKASPPASLVTTGT